MAFVPADQVDNDEQEIVILKVEEEDGEELLVTIDDEDQLEKIYNLFMERIADPEEIE